MKKKIKRWLVTDCETDAFDGQEIQPFIWGVITSEGERFLTYQTAELVTYLRGFDGIAYAHNGGKFDWLMPGVVENIDHGEIMLINGRLARAKIGRCELRDSWLIIPTALASGGEKMEFDYDILNRDKKHLRKRHKSKIEQYLMQDCVALYNMVDRFRDLHGDALTQAGAALKTWEKMGGTKRRYGAVHDAFFRPYYFGGRCEVFQYGAPLPGAFDYYDLISSYPAAMRAEHPAGTGYKMSTDYMTAPGASFWTVRAISRGAFPYRSEAGLYFPNDAIEREYKITGWELHAAIDTATADIFEGLGYIPYYTESLAPYVNKFYADKEEAERTDDAIGRILAKLFLNSLYGKYASNPENYKDYLIVAPGERYADMETTPELYGYALDIDGDGYDILSRPSKNAQYFDVALGASITGYARSILWRGICAAQGVAYCDTDSIMARSFDGDIGIELGQWKLEGKMEKLHIAGKKLYAGFYISGKKKGLWATAHKGFSKLDTDVMDVIKAAQGEIIEISKSAPSINILGVQRFIKRRMRKTEKTTKKMKILKKQKSVDRA